MLRRHKDGGAWSRLSGRPIRFGHFDDHEAHTRFTSMPAAWVRAGRQIAPEVLAAGGKTPKLAAVASAALPLTAMATMVTSGLPNRSASPPAATHARPPAGWQIDSASPR